MLYNKNQNRKVNDRKVMHKIKKHWVVVSTMLLMALGGSALTTKAPVHANVNNNDKQGTSNSNLVNENMNSKLTSQNGNQLSQSSDSQTMNSSVANSASANSVNSASGQSQSNIQNQAAHLHQRILLKTLNSSASPANNVNNGNNTDINNNNVSHHKLLGANDNNNTQQKGQIISQYLDPSDNNVLDSVDHSDTVGTPFKYNISDLKANVPSGFTWGGISPKSANINSYQPGFQVFNIIVHPIPAPQPSQIVIRYVQPKNGGMMTSDRNAQYSDTNNSGVNFDLAIWEHDLPQGYQLDMNQSDYKPVDFEGFHYIKAPLVAEQDPHITYSGIHKFVKFKPGTQLFEIGVEPAPQTTQMTVNYVDSADPSKPIKSMKTSSGDLGSVFDIKPYENVQNVPAGYQVVGNPQNVPNKYESNAQPIVIDVTRQQADMPIEYVDATDPSHLINKTTTHTKDVGLPFDIKPYETAPYVSSDYQVVGTPQNVPVNYVQNAKPIVIKLSRNPAKMTLNYVYVDNNGNAHSIKSLPINGEQGDSFDVSQYKKAPYLPSYYQSKDVVNAPTSWTNDRQVTIHVAPQSVTMPVTYQLPNGKQVGTHDATGLYDTPFDSTEYGRLATESGFVPKGYAVVDHSTLPTTYQPNQSITYTVKQLDNMNVIYVDTDFPQKNKQDRGSVPATPEADGTPFSIKPYENQSDVPDGYHIVSVGSVPGTYTDGGQAFINVRPNTLTPDNSISAADSTKNSTSATNATDSASASASASRSASASASASQSTSNSIKASVSASQSASASLSAVNSLKSSITASLVNSAIDMMNKKSTSSSNSSNNSTPSNSNYMLSYSNYTPSYSAYVPSYSYVPSSSSSPVAFSGSNGSFSSNSAPSTSVSNTTPSSSFDPSSDRPSANSDSSDSDVDSDVDDDSDTPGIRPVNQHADRDAVTDPLNDRKNGGKPNRNSENYDGIKKYNDLKKRVGNYLNLLGKDSKPSHKVHADLLGNNSHTHNGKKLPQTGENPGQKREIAAALIALGGSLMDLGVYLRRKHDND